ncbi:type II toxin-antitoxin system ParD family antitoxin [Mesorhizobium atlanticum]|uniref:Type II toxin-antitoxin system ParD family antitoxin n=1 Tax=Mesorhizobium atlanticum TaxID=2233532 RepID=A0A330GWF5_9HYPH|nr:hypothetical protein DPM35_09000 [Mesorhizobium atlanticum]
MTSEENENRSRLDRLCKAIDEGDGSGVPQPFDLEGFIEMKKRSRDLPQ